MDNRWAKCYTSAADVYEMSYRYLREFSAPKTIMRKDRKACLRIWRGTNPAAYAAAFKSFWENRADIKQRRLVKEAYYEAQRVKPAPPRKPPTTTDPKSYTVEEDVYVWLKKKGLIK